MGSSRGTLVGDTHTEVTLMVSALLADLRFLSHVVHIVRNALAADLAPKEQLLPPQHHDPSTP